MTFLEATEVLGNVGEFIGSIAVLATLIYLAVQVRHSRDLLEENRKLVLSQVHANRTQIAIENERQIGDSENLILVIDKMRSTTDWDEAFSELSSVEKRRLSSFNQQQVWRFDNLVYQMELGLLDEDLANLIKRESFPIEIWRKLGLDITPRLENWAMQHDPDA